MKKTMSMKKTMNIKKMIKIPFWIFFILIIQMTCYAGDQSNLSSETKVKKNEQQEKKLTWWELRNTREDIYYPHNIHDPIMKKEGDTCMLCHTFNKNKVTDLEQLKKLNVIANEPLEAICHDCHVAKLTAPWECDICHQDPRKIWPNDHNFNYIDHHGEDAGLDEGECSQCHIDNSFCSNCHFRRDPVQRRSHPLGFRASHGFDARMNAANCATCHNANYCSNCHKVYSK